MPERKEGVVPRLRFPEFRNAGEWEVKKIVDIFRVTRGEVLSMKLVSESYSTETPYPVYSSQTKNNGLSGYYSDYLYEDAITWTTDGANAGDVKYRKGKFYCTNVCGVLISEDGYANSFVAELLNTVTKKHVSYVGNPKLMNGVMAQIQIPFPQIKEQQKIADCLSSLDEVIELEAQKLEALKTHKKGLMQQLFPREGETTPHLRFPEFRDAGPWEVKSIKELSDKVTQGGTPNTSINEYWDGDIPWITPAEMGNDAEYHYIANTNRTISMLGLKNSSAELLPKNSVIISSRAPIGYVAINKLEMATNQGCKGIIPKVDVYYDFLYFCLLNAQRHLNDLGAGAGFKELSTSVLKKFQIPVPKLPEQQKIADCLSSLDRVIELEAQKLEALKAHKKGLLQQLFPQEVD